MNFRQLIYLAFVSSLFVFVACTKETITEKETVTTIASISDTPNIEFVKLSPETAIQYADEITLTIKYIDGNGDLGENDPDVKNLYVTDGSFMTSAGCQNPSLTYMAFTARAADHAAKELKKSKA